MRKLIALLFIAAAAPVLAQTPTPSQPHAKPKNLEVIDEVTLPKEPPPPPPRVKDDPSGTQVTIRKEADRTVEEYRTRGKLHKMRIVPLEGKPYYLIDEKGEGKFVRVDGPEPKVSVPMWVLIEW